MTGAETPPGATPIDDISGLKPKGVTTREQLYRVEAENIRKSMGKYIAAKPSRRLAPFDLPWSLKLHREMFGDVWDWAGTARTGQLNVGVEVFQIRPLLQQLINDLSSWPGFDMDWIEQATRLHHRAVSIHPFINGNGRWARLLSNIWLRQNDQPLVLWPEQTIGAKSAVREKYLAAIRLADDGDYDALLALHREYASPQQ